MTGHGDLPTEILSKIFVEALPRVLDKHGRLELQTIRSVSPKWRSICFSSPLLWSSAYVRRIPDDPIDNLGYIRLLDSWFSRSGQIVPLELMYREIRRDPIEPTAKATMESLLQRHQHRWRSLSIVVKGFRFMDTFSNLPSSNWINLDTLRLFRDDFRLDPEQDSNALTLDALEKITSLRCLVVRNLGENEPTKRCAHTNVNNLQLNLFDVTDFGIRHENLINFYPNLTKLQLNCSFLKVSPGIQLFLPSLTDFAYHGGDLTFLDHLTTPALHYLEILVWLTFRGYGEHFLGRFLTRCTASLTSLTLKNHAQGSFIAQALPLLSTRPSLTKLTLNSRSLGSDAKLFAEDVEKDWCPNLRELTISIKWDGSAQMDLLKALATFLKRREYYELPQLDILTISRRHKSIEFPHDLFKDVRLGKLHVMVCDDPF